MQQLTLLQLLERIVNTGAWSYNGNLSNTPWFLQLEISQVLQNDTNIVPCIAYMKQQSDIFFYSKQ